MIGAEQPVTSLEFLALAPSDRIANSVAHFRRIVQTIGRFNSCLRVVDGKPVPPDVRVRLYKKLLAWTDDQTKEYRLRLAFVMSLSSQDGRSYHPSAVLRPAANEVEQLSQLVWSSDLQRASFPPLDKYTQLQKVNLAGNKLTSIAGLGLEHLLKLRELDLHDNLLETTVEVSDVPTPYLFVQVI